MPARRCVRGCQFISPHRQTTRQRRDAVVNILTGTAAMQQVADWLEKLGLGQCAQWFAENDITFSLLADLTDQDLKEIGVSRSDTGVSCCVPSLPSTRRR
jgi:hypothetical protein